MSYGIYGGIRMKKIMAMVFIALLSVTATFALDMSAGGGFMYGYQKIKVEFDGALSVLDTTTDGDGFGVFGFFDATYVQVSVGYHAGDDTSYLDTAVLGKYPFAIGKCSIFPMAGLGYARAVKTDSSSSMDDLSHLYVKAGLGGDIAITKKLFIRPTVLFDYYLDNKNEKDFQDDWDATVTSYGYELSAALGYKF